MSLKLQRDRPLRLLSPSGNKPTGKDQGHEKEANDGFHGLFPFRFSVLRGFHGLIGQVRGLGVQTVPNVFPNQGMNAVSWLNGFY